MIIMITIKIITMVIVIFTIVVAAVATSRHLRGGTGENRSHLGRARAWQPYVQCHSDTVGTVLLFIITMMMMVIDMIMFIMILILMIFVFVGTVDWLIEIMMMMMMMMILLGACD